MQSSHGTVPAGLTLYQFAGKDGAGRDITAEMFLEGDDAAQRYAIECDVDTGIHVLTGRVVYERPAFA